MSNQEYTLYAKWECGGNGRSTSGLKTAVAETGLPLTRPFMKNYYIGESLGIKLSYINGLSKKKHDGFPLHPSIEVSLFSRNPESVSDIYDKLDKKIRKYLSGVTSITFDIQRENPQPTKPESPRAA
ncbi:MAG: hypothetical protein PHD31_02900 [Candidatus Pacebacteria bacterium]|nr:hypothetical protein [Candidatus Paceibacterota bacterium]